MGQLFIVEEVESYLMKHMVDFVFCGAFVKYY